jgi:hypothetical protein
LFKVVLISGVTWALHESDINRDFGLKKAIFLFRHTFSNQNFITIEFIQPFSFALIMTSLELQPFRTVFLLKITIGCSFEPSAVMQRTTVYVSPSCFICHRYKRLCQSYSPFYWSSSGQRYTYFHRSPTQPTQVIFQGQWTHKSQGAVLPNSMKKGKNLERLITAKVGLKREGLCVETRFCLSG